MRLRKALQVIIPAAFQGCAAIHCLPEECQHILGNVKTGFEWPAQFLLCPVQFFIAWRFAVRFGGILPGGQPESDVRAADDQRRPRIGFRRLDRGIDGVHIVAVGHVLHLPAVGFEALTAVFGKSQIGGTVDGNAVVIIQVY